MATTAFESIVLVVISWVATTILGSSSTNGYCSVQTTGSTLWGLSRISSRSKPAYTGTASANYTYGNVDCTNVFVYVLSSGVYTEHGEFEGRASWGYTATAVSTEGNDDLNGLGTHVAASVAGRTYGVAKRAQIISVKILNSNLSTTIGSIVAGIDWACSDFSQRQASPGSQLGVALLTTFQASPDQGHTIELAMTACLQFANLIFLTSAGDEAQPTCGVSPTSSSASITVGATTIDDSLGDFSGYGGCVDILAPGYQILSATVGKASQTALLSSTSSAAAYVAGVIAQYLGGSSPGGGTSAQRNDVTAIRTWLKSGATQSAITIPADKTGTTDLLVYIGCDGLPCPGNIPSSATLDPSLASAIGSGSSEVFSTTVPIFVSNSTLFPSTYEPKSISLTSRSSTKAGTEASFPRSKALSSHPNSTHRFRLSMTLAFPALLSFVYRSICTNQ